MTNSPILCFGFDRPMHLERMLTSLENNEESKTSTVFICIDGPTKDTDLEFEVEVDVDIEINEMETPSFYLSHLLSDHLQEDARVYRFLDTYAYEHLGNDLISYIDKYISRNPHKKHSERNSMYPSPCFFYHAAVNGKLLNKITSKPDENVIDTSDKIESPKLNEPKTVNQNPISDKDLVNLDQEIKKRGTFKYDLTGNVKPYDIHT